MSAPQVLREVFRAHHAAWGEEDDGYLFENGPAPVTRLDVLVYRPTADVDMTSFVTVGMAVETIPEGGRAELQFSCQGRLDPADENAIAMQLANLAIYPWAGAAVPVTWGQMIGLGGDFPTFPGCSAVFLSGPLNTTGRDYLETTDGPVRIINIVPITETERAQARTMPPIEFIESLMRQVNIFTRR